MVYELLFLTFPADGRDLRCPNATVSHRKQLEEMLLCGAKTRLLTDNKEREIMVMKGREQDMML